jgi:hypothetical protein
MINTQGIRAKWAVILCVVFTSVFSLLHRWNGSDDYGWEATVDGDSKGFYAYLPAVFIFHDLTFSFFQHPDNKSISRYYHPRFQINSSQGKVHKNYVGVALMLTPFFVTGHLLALATGEDTNGYSWPYMAMLITGALFYLSLGLWFILKLLRTFNFRDEVIAWSIFGISLGTNLLYYSAIHCAMAHVYAFSLTAVFLYSSRIYFIHNKTNAVIIAGLVLGLIALVRPVNLLVVLTIPLISGHWNLFISRLNDWIRNPIIVLVTFIAIVLPVSFQAILYYLQTGHFWVWSYGNEGFRFDDPQWINVLFSFRKGWFVYTPVMLLIIPGLVIMFRKSLYEGMWMFISLVLIIYITSSWWSWYYGDGYGLRSLIDIYPLFALPLAFSLEGFKNQFIKLGFRLFLITAVLLNLVQTYQYRYRIIHPDSMNFEKYVYIFLKTSERYRDVLSGGPDELFEPVSPKPFRSFRLVTDSSGCRWFENQPGFSDQCELVFNPGIEYGGDLNFLAEDVYSGEKNIYISARITRMELELNACKKALFICTVEDSSGVSDWHSAVSLNELPSDKTDVWRLREFGFRLPERDIKYKTVRFYLWNQEKKSFIITRFEIDFHRINQLP